MSSRIRHPALALESRVRYYSRRFPVVFSRAKDADLYAEDGRLYLDFLSGAGALNYGHNHSFIKEALLRYVQEDGLTLGLDMFTTAKERFLDHLQTIVLEPRRLDYKVQFCGPTGANAVEAALKLARIATGRRTVFAFGGAFHGMSLGALSASGGRRIRAKAGQPLDGVTFVPYESSPAGLFDSIGYIERLIEDAYSGVDVPAAVIVESIQMDGGVYPATEPWLRRLRQVTSKHGIVLICDEIQVGCGRTGQFFGFERAEIRPDVVTLSKSIGGMGLPMSLLLFNPELDVWEPGDHTGTFRGNQLAFVTGAAALELWEKPPFLADLSRSGRLLSEFGGHLRECEPALEVRGRGMVLGLDLGRVGGAERARALQEACFQRGVLLELCGRNDGVVKVMPPLTIPEDRLTHGLGVIWDVFNDFHGM